MKEGTLVQHKSISSFLGKVQGDDPNDKSRVIVKPLMDAEPFSCARRNLIVLGG